MWVLEFKRTDSVNYEKPLGAYIKKAYQEESSKFADDFRQLEILRKEASTSEASLSAVPCLLRYYEQLKVLQSRFPIDENNIKISFPWTNFFGKDKKYVSCSSLNFEKAAILFNLSAIYSKLASNQSFEIVESIKTACSYYMQAAGALKIILEELSSGLPLPPNTDLAERSVTSLMKLMLAQGQECFLLKAIKDNVKDSVLAKLAASAGDLYDAAYDALAQDPIADSFGIPYLFYVQGKALYLFGYAQYRKSIEVGKANAYGEQICRLDHAFTYLKKATEFSKHLSNDLNTEIKNLHLIIETSLTKAHRENDIIYHDLVPSIQSLPTVGRAEMAQAKVPTFDSSSLTPIFSTLVPLSIHLAGVAYQERRNAVVSAFSDRILNEENLLLGLLTSLNLPGAIQAAEQPKGLPESVLKKSSELQKCNAAASMERTKLEVEKLASQVSKLLDECSTMIQEEEKNDTEMKTQFQGRWNRTPSIDLNTNLIQQINKHRETFSRSSKSDSILRTRYEQYMPSIISLCSSREELERVIPSCSSLSPKSLATTNPRLERLKALLDELDRIRSSFKSMTESIKNASASDNVVPTLLQMPASSNYERIAEERLSQYDEWYAKLDNLVQQQNTLLDQIKVAHEEFERERQSDSSLREREHALQTLEDAYQNYKLLKANLEEGEKFYSDFVLVLMALKSDCEDFCLSRRIEFKDMIKSIQSISSGINNPSSNFPNSSPSPPTVAGGYRPLPNPPSAPPPHSLPHDSFQSGPNASYAPHPYAHCYSQPSSGNVHGASISPPSQRFPPQSTSAPWNPSMPIQYSNQPSGPPAVPPKPSTRSYNCYPGTLFQAHDRPK